MLALGYFLQGGGRRPQVRFHVEEPTAAAAHGRPRPKRPLDEVVAPQPPKRQYIVEKPATDAETVRKYIRTEIVVVKAIQIILECIIINLFLFSIGVGRRRRQRDGPRSPGSNCRPSACGRPPSRPRTPKLHGTSQ